MKIFNAADFGIVPNEDISEKLAEFISALKDEDGEKTAVFDSGTYYIDSERCKEYMLVITNTAGEKEFSPDETPHLNAVPFYFGGISNLVFDGGDFVFVIDGKVTNIAVEDCRNITLRNLEIRHAHPDMHEFSVVRKSAFSVDFKIDSDSSFSVENGKLVFSGHGYKNCCDMSSVNAGWIGLIREKTPEKVKRVMHPLFSSLSVRDMGGGVVRAKYLNTSRFTLGDRFYYYDVRRRFAGIFINRSENITLENIKQRFNYSLALVAQDSENLTVDSVDFSPEQGSARLLASVADFIQLCMCRGLMTVKNSHFSGAAAALVCIMFIFSATVSALPLDIGFSTTKLSAEERNRFLGSINFESTNKESDWESISCFDVSDSGYIAIVGESKNGHNSISVYDKDGKFAYGYTLDCSGRFGVGWDGDNIAVYFVREDIAATFDRNANNITCDEIPDTTANSSYWSNEVLYKTRRVKNGVRYEMKNTGKVASAISPAYAVFEMTEPDGTVHVIFDNSKDYDIKLIKTCIAVVVSFAVVASILTLKTIEDRKKIKQKINKREL